MNPRQPQIPPKREINLLTDVRGLPDDFESRCRRGAKAGYGDMGLATTKDRVLATLEAEHQCRGIRHDMVAPAAPAPVSFANPFVIYALLIIFAFAYPLLRFGKLFPSVEDWHRLEAENRKAKMERYR